MSVYAAFELKMSDYLEAVYLYLGRITSDCFSLSSIPVLLSWFFTFY